MAKDIFLYIAGRYGQDVGLYKSIEWTGPVADAMSIDSRLCIACSSTELAAKFSIFETDEKARNYVQTRSAVPFTAVSSDKDASFEKEYTVDVDDMEPQVAFPHGFEVIKPVSKVEGVKVDKARIGACTNGRVEDLAAAAKILKGKRVHPDTFLYVAPASRLVFKDALEAGIISTLVDAGVVIGPAGCGPCESHLLVTAPGEVDISATTRNFIGRHGSSDAEIYLASPATVAASALKGVITDPREMM